MDHEKLRSAIRWHAEYTPEWDSSPGEYADGGVVQWGRSRRLGLIALGEKKAYLGVQHVDPNKPGWAIVKEAQARFFISYFVSGICMGLRTFPTMQAALDALDTFFSV